MTTVHEKIMDKRICMINNEDAFPDVTFVLGFGSRKKEITAHKVFLMTASEVFEAMFSKKFVAEGDTKVVVEDIEEGPFLQVLQYCYTLKVSITEDNMLGILYAAEKYMLSELMEQCMAYVCDRINEPNCLKIFNATHLLSCAPVNDKCRDLFQRNPMKFFKDCSFPDLCFSALRMLVELPKMNCSGADLKRAAYLWFLVNDYCQNIGNCDELLLLKYGFSPGDFEGKQLHSATCEGRCHVRIIKKFQSISVEFQILAKRWLLGVGLCLGICGSPKDEMVKLTISQRNVLIHTEKRNVRQTENFSITEIMFSKLKIRKGSFVIKVDFESEESRFVSKHSICAKSHYKCNTGFYYHDCQKSKKCDKNIASDPALPFSCLAYLIYAES